MSKGNLENVLGGVFVAGPGLEAEVESNVDHGPALIGVDSPEILFKKTYNEESHKSAKEFAPKYKEISGRPDPFDTERMILSMGTWSVLTNKSVMSFAEALEHALALCRLWQQEDEELAKISQTRKKREADREAVAKTNIMVEGTHEYEVEQARLAWREAVRQRNEITKQWNDYVASVRERYHQLRDS